MIITGYGQRSRVLAQGCDAGGTQIRQELNQDSHCDVCLMCSTNASR